LQGNTHSYSLLEPATSHQPKAVSDDERCSYTEVKAGDGIANDQRPLVCLFQGRSR
jgi:hypothetical protein